ncbi:MAG TPA: branched-chain amino acid ABC transporter ATP-binding protein/permease [Burkholderiales bacterium]|nr:branched-chain amino acid ABC transporter ATP-binding protein/permease [Burkholderiales bacterium]
MISAEAAGPVLWKRKRGGRWYLSWLWLIVALTGFPLVLVALGSTIDSATRILIWGLFGIGFDILFGITGLLSFGQAAFFGTGGFVTAYLLISGAINSVAVALLIGTVLASVYGVFVGFLSLRRTGIYFAMITFAFGELSFFMENSLLKQWTGGDNGLPGVPYPVIRLGGWVVEIHAGWPMYALVAAIFLIGFAFARQMVNSPLGHILKAIRLNPDRTLATGHNVQTYKLAAFVVAAAYAGLAGGLFGIFQSYMPPDAFGLDTSTQVMIQTVIGGVGTLIGSTVGAAVWIGLREALQQIPGIGGMWKLILGCLFVISVTVFRHGIVGAIRNAIARVRRDNRPPAQREPEPMAVAADATGADRTDGGAAVVLRPNRRPPMVRDVKQAPVLLEARGITKKFGGVTALENVSITVGEGEVIGLIGPNGAGKSTFFKVLTGELQPTAGDVYFKKRRITGIGVMGSCRQGISKSYQVIQIYPEFTVRENLDVPLLARRGAFRFDVFGSIGGAIDADAERIMETLGLMASADRKVSELPYGEKRRLEIALALATAPEVLLLDEPLAGLSPSERVQAVDVIRTACIGKTAVLVEHDMDAMFELADRIIVLHMGRNLVEGTPDEIRADPQVHEAYLGGWRKDELAYG